MAAAIQRAETIRAQLGSHLPTLEFSMDRSIGEGFLIGGHEYRISERVRVVFNADGSIRTAYPALRIPPQ
jgi:hypothetical protein